MARAYGEAAIPKGRHGLAPDAVAAQQRERVFSAIVELVAEHGYRHTSIDQIVKSAQVGYGAFYDLFAGKEDCFVAAFDRIAEETSQALLGAVAGEQAWPHQISAALACLVKLLIEHPQRARLALVEVHAAGPRARGRYENALDTATPKLREGRAWKPRATRLTPALEGAVVGGAAWIIHQRLLEGDLKQTEPLLEELLEIVVAPYISE